MIVTSRENGYFTTSCSAGYTSHCSNNRLKVKALSYNYTISHLLTDCIESVLRLQLAPDTDTIKEFPEYCYNDTWSRICTIDGTWITNETRTRVACGQLGYSEESE